MTAPLPNRRRMAAAVGTAVALALSAGLGTVAAAAPTRSAVSPGTDAAAQSGVDSSRAIVQLSMEPLATSSRTRPAKGKKIDFSGASVRSERALLSAQRNQFKQWLRSAAPQARVTREFDVAVNAVAVALNGVALSVLKAGPGVVSVSPGGIYVPLDDRDPDLSLIRALQAWQAPQVGGGSNAGRGVRVGIVDTGIDAAHPCFDGTGYPAFNGRAGDGRLTSAKVVVAKVFNMRASSRGYSAAAVQSHGTHVAGTVACELDTPASVNGAAIPYAVSGVAPAAQLGNYNVFPADVQDARSEDILDALDEAAEDGMDVINMSLGGGAHGIADLLTNAVDNLDRANIVVAVANGNSGPGHYTVESPGSAERALSAGAATVPHFVGLPLVVGGRTLAVATGDFAAPLTELTAPLKAVLSGPALGLACSALPVGSLVGRIAVVSRGTCSFSTKIRNAQLAGAVAVVVVNNVAGDPTAMGQDGTADQPTVPGVMVAQAEGDALIASDGADATLGSVMSYQPSANADIMAGFSSQGPTDVDFRVKPDVVAPGVNVLSSVPGDCGAVGCWAFFGGTSMAAPHLAGMAAVIRAARPGLTAEEVRSAIVNTADPGVLRSYKDGTRPEEDVNIVGAGRADLLAATQAQVAIGPVSTSFGAVPAGAGRKLTRSVQVTNLGTAPATFALSVEGGPFSVGSSTVRLAAGATTEVPVTVSFPRDVIPGDYQGKLTVSRGGVQLAHSVLYVFAK